MNIEALERFIYQQQPQWKVETRYPFEHMVAVYFNNWHTNLPGGARRTVGADILKTKRPMKLSRQEMTGYEFFDAVDQAFARQEIDPEEVIALQEKMEKTEDTNDYMELIVLTFPAFRLLMEEGFTRHDLTV